MIGVGCWFSKEGCSTITNHACQIATALNEVTNRFPYSSCFQIQLYYSMRPGAYGNEGYEGFEYEFMIV